MKNENLITNYKNGEPLEYVAIGTPNLRFPSCAFKTREEAEFCIALVKLLKANDKDTSEIIRLLPYMFRMIGIKSQWSE